MKWQTDNDALNVLRLGAGVQSSAVLLMSLEGDLPKLDHVIFADTGWEPAAVYAHLDWLDLECAKHGLAIARVSNGNIVEDATRNQLQLGITEDGKTRWGSMPLFIRNPDGTGGMIRRQCTYEYKIRPITTYVKRTILKLRPRQRGPKKLAINTWYGISLDEMQRMRTADHKWELNCYPLIDLRITREGCEAWLAKRGVNAPRSACLGCPFHSDKEWRHIRDTDPEGWQSAVEFDRLLRANPDAFRGEAYLHSQRIPLDEVDLRTDVDKGQLLLWDDECSGICGV